MRCADSVDVDALHVEDFLLGLLVRDSAAGLLAEVVAVDTSEQNAATVDGECSIVTDANLAKADFTAAHVYNLITILKGEDHVVELGGLGGPETGSGHLNSQSERAHRREW